ncbi:flagellar FlbD family protein [Alkalibacillus haloalkaliphilus]|uniref:flagellar FlbD family protein n=1 Tax=Alkalibacillus haloalkaliphilus TaxID=94136 RepID=UPI0029361BCB|nr:flagellar FlbD family protein [Alkalibacillus haloalkaliphilus]MDV2580607.1 flagellar FlbD family protein [Alkalibacillus haloalkaliphilus]
MITVTRLNGEPFVLNALYIEKVQALPDTTISLANGKTYFVQESVETVIQLSTDYYRNVGLIDLHAKVVDENDETN